MDGITIPPSFTAVSKSFKPNFKGKYEHFPLSTRFKSFWTEVHPPAMAKDCPAGKLPPLQGGGRGGGRTIN